MTAAILHPHPQTALEDSPLQQVTADEASQQTGGELIRLENVRKTYNAGQENEFEALKGVSLEITQGEFVAIMGPSGSGKSTLMNIMGALDVPTSGQYFVHGTDVGSMNSGELAEFRNQDVGFVFQQFNLLPRQSVRDNVLLPVLYGYMENPEARMQNLLERVGLSGKLDNRPNQLSGGEMQRVAIARALIMDPSIIMADEPTGNLDTKTSVEIMKLFQEIHAEGNTIILITHEDDIAEYADRVITIRDGLIQS